MSDPVHYLVIADIPTCTEAAVTKSIFHQGDILQAVDPLTDGTARVDEDGDVYMTYVCRSDIGGHIRRDQITPEAVSLASVRAVLAAWGLESDVLTALVNAIARADAALRS